MSKGVVWIKQPTYFSDFNLLDRYIFRNFQNLTTRERHTQQCRRLQTYISVLKLFVSSHVTKKYFKTFVTIWLLFLKTTVITYTALKLLGLFLKLCLNESFVQRFYSNAVSWRTLYKVLILVRPIYKNKSIKLVTKLVKICSPEKIGTSSENLDEFGTFGTPRKIRDEWQPYISGLYCTCM